MCRLVDGAGAVGGTSIYPRMALTIVDQTHKGWKRALEGDGTYMLSKPYISV
jgi:hypothetical protein